MICQRSTVAGQVQELARSREVVPTLRRELPGFITGLVRAQRRLHRYSRLNQASAEVREWSRFRLPSSGATATVGEMLDRIDVLHDFSVWARQ